MKFSLSQTSKFPWLDRVANKIKIGYNISHVVERRVNVQLWNENITKIPNKFDQ